MSGGHGKRGEPRVTIGRRDFFKVYAAAGVAVLQGCRRRDQELIESPVRRSTALPGASVWRRSICEQCGAGCEIEVRTVDRLAKKIEGLPSGFVNRGGVCALGHSALQELYHPDRVTEPMRRGSSGELEPVSWEEALETAATAIAAAPDATTIVAGAPSGPLLGLWRRFAATVGTPPPVHWQPADAVVEREAARLAFGESTRPAYDLARSDYVVSVGAPCLDRWRSPVHLGAAWAELTADRRGKLVQVEARHSLTAANADDWLPVRPGSEGFLARGLAGLLLGSGAVGEEGRAAYEALYPGAPPDLAATAERCGIDAGRIERLAAELARARRPLVMAGGSALEGENGVAAGAAALALNLLLDSVGREGGVFAGVDFGFEDRLAGDAAAALPPAALAERLAGDGGSGVLVVSEADPLHGMPGLEAAFEHADTVIACSAFFDDTALRADVVLPVQTDLERFQAVEPDPVRGVPALLVASPTVAPRGEARHPGDVALALAAAAGSALPWPGFQEAVESALSDAFAATRAAGDEASDPAALPASLIAGALNARQFVRRTTDAGGLVGTEEMRRAPVPDARADVPVGIVDPASLPAPAAPAGVESFTLIPFESLKLADGRGANRPWLQELPDPLSTVMWGSWAEVGTEDADRLGVRTGDIVRLTGTAAEIELPAIVLPTVRPGSVGVPVGGGHADYGRYARGRGVNVNSLLDPDRRVAGAGAFARSGVRVRIERLRRPRRSERPVIYGRGLRQAEEIPVGWAPHDGGKA
ncbi:MAG: molybdopterin-dependent oxidoreductase [Holophagales bacterium]|nr:molybdopterin-dependent oxidoreductase [Holophagales bacterium]MYG29844.1 molybdopterin-dependent oxidoreductase [Holophagales bacterium]MYI79258.1 molybdopterin-dependent oxidoreductase [Holophagales bacterium]